MKLKVLPAALARRQAAPSSRGSVKTAILLSADSFACPVNESEKQKKETTCRIKPREYLAVPVLANWPRTKLKAWAERSLRKRSALSSLGMVKTAILVSADS